MAQISRVKENHRLSTHGKLLGLSTTKINAAFIFVCIYLIFLHPFILISKTVNVFYSKRIIGYPRPNKPCISMYKPCTETMVEGDFRPSTARRLRDRFSRNLKRITASRTRPSTQNFRGLCQRGWSGQV